MRHDSVLGAQKKFFHSEIKIMKDGAGLMVGTPEEFAHWLEKVNKNLKPFNLLIDESSIGQTNSFISFLDIQFCFDVKGDLQTDLYVKPTDSRSYLNFGSGQCTSETHIFWNRHRLLPA